jgi:hypothetical protein
MANNNTNKKILFLFPVRYLVPSRSSTRFYLLLVDYIKYFFFFHTLLLVLYCLIASTSSSYFKLLFLFFQKKKNVQSFNHQKNVIFINQGRSVM